MKYWVVKGRPSENDFDKICQPGTEGTWHTKRPPKNWNSDDRIFFWKSSPAKQIIALAEILSISNEKDWEGFIDFDVKYMTRPLDSNLALGIEELRADPQIKLASFLKSGPAQTVFPLSEKEGEHLYRLITLRDPAFGVWKDIKPSPTSLPVVVSDDVFEDEFPEGKLKTRIHQQKERSRQAVELKKQQVLQKTGKLACETCGFDFSATYGSLGVGFIECHHIQPIATLKDDHRTRLKDLSLVCSNCHRMLHKSRPMQSVEALRKLIKKSGA